MKPSTVLKLKRIQILEILKKYKVTNPRVFGSVLYGNDKEDSDLDLLVDSLPGVTLLDLGGLHDELETSLGIKVDLRLPGDLPLKFRSKVVKEALPL